MSGKPIKPAAKPTTKSVRIAAEQQKPTLSKGQRYFNSLVKQIGSRRSRLARWEAANPVFQKRYVDELLPLEKAGKDARAKMVHRLDEVHGEMPLTAAERRVVSQLIVAQARDLIPIHDDATLKAIYNRHGKTDYDAEAKAEREHMKALMEATLGVDFGDDIDLSSHEAFMRGASEKVDAMREEQEAQRQARQARREKRKKTPKQMEAQARKEAQQAEVSQSIRDVYRKLASALHPDRETDPQERERKTALMQRVNQAYAKNNLLQLFELQLELEHIDQNTINEISEERLKHYNSVLWAQLGELDREIVRVEDRFKGTYGIPLNSGVSPEGALENIALQIEEDQVKLQAVESDLSQLDDIKKVRAWLKAIKRKFAYVPPDDFPF